MEPAGPLGEGGFGSKPSGGQARPLIASHALPPAGARVLVPGYAQWAWQQRERGLVLFGSFSAALGVAAFAWGTTAGLVVLTFAFGTHVISAADAIRQSAFPGFGRWVTLAGAAGGLAVGVYGPLLTVAALLAWPGMSGGSGDGYLINCWAYRNANPRQDDQVWFRGNPWGEPRLGQVVAAGGQEVGWAEGQLQIDGLTLTGITPFRTLRTPTELLFRVPEDHVLVDPAATALTQGRRTSEGLILVPKTQVLGRAWARLYPVRERQFLP